MGRQRSPNRDRAYEMWKESNGTKPLKSIAEELGEPETLVRKWNSRINGIAKVTLPKRKKVTLLNASGAHRKAITTQKDTAHRKETPTA